MTNDNDCPIYVTFRVENQGMLQHLVGVLSGDGEIETISVADPCSDEGSNVTTVDFGSLTEKQWEALEVAHGMGHYGTKRGGHLEDIANELGISKSAASQRLRSAEAKIVNGILGTGRLGCSEWDPDEAELEYHL